MSSVDLTAIMASIAAIQQQLPLPTGVSQLPQVNTEPPDTYNSLPCWVNIEEITDLDKLRAFGRDTGKLEHTITMYLLLGPGAGKYSIAERRLWSQPVTDAFEADANLNGACDGLFLSRISYGLASFNGLDFFATQFRLRVLAARS